MAEKSQALKRGPGGPAARRAAAAHTPLAPAQSFPHDGLPMRSYSGFLFDADNTIFDYDRAEREALTETFQEAIPRADLEGALAHYRTINAGFWRRFEEGGVSLAELKPGRFRALLDALGAPGDPTAISDSYLGRLAEKAHMVPHAREVLEWLAARASLCLVTNGLSSVQQGRLRRAGIGGMFRALLISEEIGISKPDPAFFLRAAEALSLPPPRAAVRRRPSLDRYPRSHGSRHRRLLVLPEGRALASGRACPRLRHPRSAGARAAGATGMIPAEAAGGFLGACSPRPLFRGTLVAPSTRHGTEPSFCHGERRPL